MMIIIHTLFYSTCTTMKWYMCYLRAILLYMLFAGRIVKTVAEVLKCCPRPKAFSSPRSQFFTIWADPKPVNNLLIFFQALKRKKKTHGKKLTRALL